MNRDSGQYGMARAEIQRIPNALLIPQQAVSQLQGNNEVAVVNPDGKAEIRAIKRGPTRYALRAGCPACKFPACLCGCGHRNRLRLRALQARAWVNANRPSKNSAK